MNGDFVAIHLNEDEYKRAFELNKRYEVTYDPYLVIRILNHYDENVFDGLVCRGSSFSIDNAIDRREGRLNTLVADYYEKKNSVLTFDGIKFFRIINIYEEVESELLFFTFQFILRQSFSNRNTAFMIMPFRNEHLNAFYTNCIKNFLFNSDLRILVERSDDYTGTDVVADTILEQIKKAEFIICDITSCNKNVFFEIGYAAGINKDMIFLLEQNKPADFFDINHKRRIEYSFEREDEFKKLLHDTLVSLRNNRL